MRVTPWILCSAALISGCFGAPRMAEPEAAATSMKAPVPRGGPEAVVAPLAFAATEYKGCLAVGELKCKDAVTVVYASFLVRTGAHELMIDAGLGRDVQDWLARFPRWQQKSLAVEPTAFVGAELARFQVDPAALDPILITHSHWDHTVGLSDLRAANVLMSQVEVDHVAALEKEVDHGTVAKVFDLPQVKVSGFTFDGPPVGPFPASHDLYGDGLVILLPMPGHTPGSTGVLLPNVGGRPVLFVGDVVWNRQGLEIPSHRSRLASRSVDDDRDALSQTIYRIRTLMEADPELLIVPAHDILAWKELEELSDPWVVAAP